MMEEPNKVTMIAKSLPYFNRKEKHEFIDLADKLKAILSISAHLICTTFSWGRRSRPQRGTTIRPSGCALLGYERESERW